MESHKIPWFQTTNQSWSKPSKMRAPPGPGSLSPLLRGRPGRSGPGGPPWEGCSMCFTGREMMISYQPKMEMSPGNHGKIRFEAIPLGVVKVWKGP